VFVELMNLWIRKRALEKKARAAAPVKLHERYVADATPPSKL
jgi:hypothetical protein